MQNKNSGKKFIEKLEVELRNKGIIFIYLLTKNNSPAEYFYLKRGFKIFFNKIPVKGKIIMYKNLNNTKLLHQ